MFRCRRTALVVASFLLASPASAQIYLPPGVGLPAQSVIGNTKNMTGDAVAVSFSQLKASLNVPQAQSCATSSWVNSISSTGVFGCVQPSIGDISGLGSGVQAALTDAAGGAGGFALQNSLASYLPLAGGTMSGNVAMGGNNISGIGIVTATTYSGLPTGSSSTAGVVKVDGTTITASGGVISATVAASAWSTFTPSMSCGTGGFTVNNARYLQNGKTVYWDLDVTLTTVGTCSVISWTGPATAKSAISFIGREIANTGNALVGSASAGSASFQAIRVAGSAATNDHYAFSGVYESQ